MPFGADRSDERTLHVGTDRPIRISTGHRLLHHDGKCSRPHGHNYDVTVAATGRDDLPEIERLVARVREAADAAVPDSTVLLMAEGTTRTEFDDRRAAVADLATEYGYRYTPRLHVDLWDDAAGK